MTDTSPQNSPLIHLTTPPPAPPAATAAKPAPSAAQWADMSPEQRFEHQQREGDRALGTYRAPERQPGVKVDDSTYDRMTHQEKIAYASSFNQPGQKPDGSPADPAAPPAVDPNAKLIKVGEAEFPEAEVKAALAEKTARDANLASLPAKPPTTSSTFPPI